MLSPLLPCSPSQLQSPLHIGWSSSKVVAMQDATIIQSTDVLEAKEFRINPLVQLDVLSSTRNGGESHRKRRSQYHRNYNIPNQSPWLQQLAQFSTSPTPTPDSSSSSSVPPSLSVAARTAPRPVVKHKLDPTRIPTPPSGIESEMNPLESLKKASPRSIVRKGVDGIISAFTTLLRFFFQLPGNLYYYLTHPTETRKKYADMKQAVKDEIHHYWVGFKLLWADIQTSRSLVVKTLQGSSLTRRERKQLLRTVSDLFRMVPFSMFIIIPLGEFALPFVLRLFPNMLPSTFQDSLKNEENMKRELQSRIAMASFFHETLEELAKEQRRKAKKKTKELQEAGDEVGMHEQEDSARSMLEFLESARSGRTIPPELIIKYATYFQDDLTLDNMPRMQLINMCKYMGIPPYGSDSFLRFQLRHRIRILKEDDQRILWEGIDSLTKMELREACRERGMRSTGLSKDAFKRMLIQWLELSVEKNVPISLLIMSRTFFLQEEAFERKPDEEKPRESLAGLADTISGLDKEVLNEVILNVATSEEKMSNPDVRKIKLEVLSKQNELIREEEAAREAAKKQKVKTEAGAATEAEAEKAAIEEPVSATATPTKAEPVVVAAPESMKAVPSPNESTEEISETKAEHSLTSAEMDAISQLLSEDPVSMERAQLEKIKAAMQKEKPEPETTPEKESGKLAEEKVPAPVPEATPRGPMSSDEADQLVESSIRESEDRAAKESAESTTVTTTGPTEEPTTSETEESEDDVVIRRLKKRIESMVDKIEVQLSETEVKIGDKLHYLDKDKDGILSQDELAEVLQQVLKRKISLEEARQLAKNMDENSDGIFTVQELIQWIDEHKLVQFVEEGRDADMDRILLSLSMGEKQPKQQQQQQQQQQQPSVESSSPDTSSNGSTNK
ncbi:hypothetical protein FisN_3Lh540 [Fistulifera solaris]|uniref:Mitochondrial proton/calcium exchanger protein n=1 Tax=Fistulifera solaris TaxID=1519565 RepID=A0A1Z5J8K3_FISSO|nr:hypothetical protein FisN_3Lh540 [Fistulifera solaris]|eukprot:GAX10333.1 hypothetical protein FisN_3Lh540 [Fistulifera solaris]